MRSMACLFVMLALASGCPSGSEGEGDGLADGGTQGAAGGDGQGASGTGGDDGSGTGTGGSGAPAQDAGAGTGGGEQDAGSPAQDAGGSVVADAGTMSGSEPPEGPPELPADPFAMGATGAVSVAVRNSSSASLPSGLYGAPHSANGSSAGSVSFLPGGLALVNAPSLQVQISWRRMQQSGSFACEDVTDVLIRYGQPPSGFNQLLAHDCEVEFTYDEADNSYTGSFTGSFGDGLSEPSDTATAEIEGVFSFVDGE